MGCGKVEDVVVIVYIYGLYASDDPLQAVRYVGKTTELKKRLHQHLHERKDKPKNRWIKEVLARGAEVKLELIETASVDSWQQIERDWIAASEILLNIAKGGGATFRNKPSKNYPPKQWAVLVEHWRTTYNCPVHVEDRIRREWMHITYNPDA